MKNVLMQVLRETHGYNKKQIADKLGMTPQDYIELETSLVAMTPEQAYQLAAVYNIHQEYFLESSRQLELLLTRNAVVQQQQSEIEHFRQFMFIHKELFLDSVWKKKTEVNDENVSDEQEITHQ
ncbi:helix-turn-helix domain protein [Niastella koreensis GR20-10]|uniref:Helix-turn-helix domain protein n=3 Tax=Niastella koreensis TaxID=354356 RepID=G8T901_NIAKG|nr:helix-turn-helix transcriptional regulator [Niastella koreensis]AEW02358.1 helix-turn-helix domain protein [Niastella koreensis GR20-10]